MCKAEARVTFILRLGAALELISCFPEQNGPNCRVNELEDPDGPSFPSPGFLAQERQFLRPETIIESARTTHTDRRIAHQHAHPNTFP